MSNNDRFKFRVWDKIHKKYVTGFSVDQNGTLLINDWVSPPNQSNFVLEKSIGKKDKNKKLIFEGDVVRTDENGWDGIVKWDNNMCWFFVEDIAGGFATHCNWGKYEVVGSFRETFYNE